MTNYIQIDSIQNQRWKQYAEKIDGRKPNVNDPNDVGDAGDRQLSEREIKKLENMIKAYYTSNPQKDNLGVQVPTGQSVADAMKEVFGGTANYLKYQADQALKYLGKLVSKAAV
jgi:hypothetical protein